MSPATIYNLITKKYRSPLIFLASLKLLVHNHLTSGFQYSIGVLPFHIIPWRLRLVEKAIGDTDVMFKVWCSILTQFYSIYSNSDRKLFQSLLGMDTCKAKDVVHEKLDMTWCPTKSHRNSIHFPFETQKYVYAEFKARLKNMSFTGNSMCTTNSSFKTEWIVKVSTTTDGSLKFLLKAKQIDTFFQNQNRPDMPTD